MRKLLKYVRYSRWTSGRTSRPANHLYHLYHHHHHHHHPAPSCSWSYFSTHIFRSQGEEFMSDLEWVGLPVLPTRPLISQQNVGKASVVLPKQEGLEFEAYRGLELGWRARWRQRGRHLEVKVSWDSSWASNGTSLPNRVPTYIYFLVSGIH